VREQTREEKISLGEEYSSGRSALGRSNLYCSDIATAIGQCKTDKPVKIVLRFLLVSLVIV
jgi:hypothetical protein